MRHYSGPSLEGCVHFSERIVLGCWCGERLILLGLDEDWWSEKIVFECECGAQLTLVDRLEEEIPRNRGTASRKHQAPGA